MSKYTICDLGCYYGVRNKKGKLMLMLNNRQNAELIVSILNADSRDEKYSDELLQEVNDYKEKEKFCGTCANHPDAIAKKLKQANAKLIGEDENE